MKELNIFDDNEWIATISVIDTSSFLFARSPREWTDIKRIMFAVERLQEADPKVNFLEQVASMAHSYNYNTELINE